MAKSADGGEDWEEHPCFGMLQISRISSGGETVLFGTSINHLYQVVLRIATGRRRRRMNHDQYMRDEEIIEVRMSPTQYASAITSMNMGEGTPVTISRVRGETVPGCPKRAEDTVVRDEFRQRMETVAGRADDAVDRLQELLDKKSITKADIRTTLDIVSKLRMEIGQNLPFMHEMFHEAIDATVAEAKDAIDAHVLHTVVEAGLGHVLPGGASPQLLTHRNEASPGEDD